MDDRLRGNALSTAGPGTRRSVSVPPGDYGPVPVMMSSLLSDAQAGGLDGALLTNRQFYQTDYTKTLMFLDDGGGLRQPSPVREPPGRPVGDDERDRQYPGQVWLWLYTFWYQMRPFSTSANAEFS